MALRNGEPSPEPKADGRTPQRKWPGWVTGGLVGLLAIGSVVSMLVLYVGFSQVISVGEKPTTIVPISRLAALVREGQVQRIVEEQAQVIMAMAADPAMPAKFRADLAWLAAQCTDARDDAQSAKYSTRAFHEEIRAVRGEMQALADDPSVPTAARIRLERLAGRLLAIASQMDVAGS